MDNEHIVVNVSLVEIYMNSKCLYLYCKLAQIGINMHNDIMIIKKILLTVMMAN